MDANLEEDAIVGSFDAGQLGFSDRSVVNLDGLINHVSYFENVLRDGSPGALVAYIDRLGIDYVVDHNVGLGRGVIEREFAPDTRVPARDWRVGQSFEEGPVTAHADSDRH